MRAGLAGTLLVAAAFAAAWLLGLDADASAPGGWLLVGAGAAGWFGATVAGCFGPLPGGRGRDVVLDAAIALSAISVAVLAVGIGVLAASG